MTLWYPTYVSEINIQKDKVEFDNFCSKNVTDINSTTLPDYCGCNGTVFHDSIISDVHLEKWNVSDVVLNNVTFERVNFSDVSFTNTDFVSGSSFIDCNFHHSQILNSFLDNFTFDSLSLFDSRLCGTTATNITVRNSLTISNTSINSYQNSTPTVVLEGNSSFFMDLLEFKYVNISNDSCATGDVNEWPIQCLLKEDDFRVYRDSFFISASALPGNIVSAVAVYFFTRKYWLGKTVDPINIDSMKFKKIGTALCVTIQFSMLDFNIPPKLRTLWSSVRPHREYRVVFSVSISV